jgi:GAF domain-containing protein
MGRTSVQFRDVLDEAGLWSAMNWLNQTVPYRYSAIFSFDGDMLRSVCLVDKQDSAVKRCGDQPVTDSYCIYIQRTAQKFSVEEAALDVRVSGHPKQKSFQSYYGVPLMGRDGKLVGTVCHFDANPISLTGEIVTDLDDVAGVIAEAVSEELR